MSSNLPVSESVAARRWGMPSIPTETEVLPELQVLLDRWIDGSGILVVDAPLGFGKSTQVAAWLGSRSADEPVIWISMSSFIRSWDDARYALLTALIDLGLVSPLRTDGAVGLIDVHVAMQQLTQRITVVFDDIDTLPDTDLEAAELDAQRFPLVRHIYVTSSSTEGPSDRVDPHRVTITRHDLAWSPAFARRVLNRARTGPAELARLDDVISATDGRASAILNLGHSSGGTLVFGLAEDYRARWMLERADHFDRSGRAAKLLMLLSFFLEAPLGLLAEFGFDDVPELLPALRRKGFVTTVGTDPEFPDALMLLQADREALETVVLSERARVVTDVHARAAAYFIRLGRNHLALYHLAKSRQYEAALEELKKPWGNGQPDDDLITIRLALAELPVDLLAADPEALALRIISGYIPPVERAERMSEAEAALLLIPSDRIASLSPRARLLVTTATMVTLLFHARSADAVVRGLRLAATFDNAPWEELRALGRTPGLFWTVLAEAEIIEGRVRGALAHATLAADWNRELGHPYASVRAMLALAAALALEGDIAASTDRLVQAERLAEQQQQWSSEPPLYTAAIASLFNALGRMDPDATAAAARAFRLLAPLDEFWSMGATVAETYTLLVKGDVKDAMGLSAAALHSVRSRSAPPIIHHLVIGVHIDVLIALGRPGAALALLSTAGDSPDHAFCYAGRSAVAHLALGDANAAMAATERCVDIGLPHVLRTMPQTLLARAAAQQARGLERAADATFADALAIQQHSPRPGAFFNIDPAWLEPLWSRLEKTDPLLHSEMLHLAAPVGGSRRARPRVAISHALSERELDVLAVLGRGGSYRVMGESLYLSANTVKSHLSSIYRKLGVSSRREALDVAQQLGLSTGTTSTES